MTMNTSQLPTSPPTNYLRYGENPELDEHYHQLGLLEERDFDARCMGRTDLVAELKEQMRPLRRKIVEIEGWQVYPEDQT